MRRLCLAVLFCVMFVSGAKADRAGMFIKIECNRDFGLLDIGKYSISGAKLGDYFYQDFVTYEYDINKKGKSNVDIVVYNAYNPQKVYRRYCELAPNQKFEIITEPEGIGRHINDVSFYVTVTEYLEDLKTKEVKETKLLDKVIIGAGGQIDKINIAAKDDNKGTDITLERSRFVAYFMEPERDKPLTEDVIKAEREDLERRAKELEYEEAQEGYCEKHSCGVDIEDMPSLEKLSEVLQDVLAENAAKKAETEDEEETAETKEDEDRKEKR
ncbi:MAG: hypothetical protein J6C85_06745 [Alphaproteobacteria bacterium]|nr:hypothetical protein [Alphaproteobacteria bacterium]